jgi:hypothetical protein
MTPELCERCEWRPAALVVELGEHLLRCCSTCAGELRCDPDVLLENDEEVPAA